MSESNDKPALWPEGTWRGMTRCLAAEELCRAHDDYMYRLSLVLSPIIESIDPASAEVTVRLEQEEKKSE